MPEGGTIAMPDRASPPPRTDIHRQAASAITRIRRIAEELAGDPRNERLAAELGFAIDWISEVARKIQADTEASRHTAAVLAAWNTAHETRVRQAAAAREIAAGRQPDGRPALRVIRGGSVPVWIAALAAGFARLLHAKWRAAAVTALTASAAGGLTATAWLPVTTTPMQAPVQAARAAASPAPVTVRAAIPAPARPQRHHRHGRTPAARPAPRPAPGPVRTRPPAAAAPVPPPLAAAVPASPVLHPGPDGRAILILTAPDGPACWSATTAAPVIITGAGHGCLAAGQQADIPVVTAGPGTITVISGGQAYTVTVTCPPRARTGATA